MRVVVLARFSGAAAALVVYAFVPPMVEPQAPVFPGERPVAPAPHERPDPTRDLKLIATFDGKPVKAGTVQSVGLTLVNASKTTTYRVVRPGDGSETGGREPYVHFTGEQLTVQGQWVPLRGYTIRECGLFDHDWQKDIVELKPGETLPVTNQWIPMTDFRLQHPGTIRVTGHYEYRAGRRDANGAIINEDRSKMGDTPAFAIHSEPVEFSVIRPLDLKIRVKGELKVGVEKTISEVIDITLTNTTDRPIRLISGGTAGHSVEMCGGGPEANNPQLTDYAAQYGRGVELKPGQTLSLLGPGELANGADGKWTGRKPGKYALRVSYAFNPDTRETVDAIAEIPVVE
jgi:hypothetical protein